MEAASQVAADRISLIAYRRLHQSETRQFCLVSDFLCVGASLVMAQKICANHTTVG